MAERGDMSSNTNEDLDGEDELLLRKIDVTDKDKNKTKLVKLESYKAENKDINMNLEQLLKQIRNAITDEYNSHEMKTKDITEKMLKNISRFEKLSSKFSKFGVAFLRLSFSFKSLLLSKVEIDTDGISSLIFFESLNFNNDFVTLSAFFALFTIKRAPLGDD